MSDTLKSLDGWVEVGLGDLPKSLGALPPTLQVFRGLEKYFNQFQDTFRVITYRARPAGDYYIKVVDDSRVMPIRWYSKSSSILEKIQRTCSVAFGICVYGIGTAYLVARG